MPDILERLRWVSVLTILYRRATPCPQWGPSGQDHFSPWQGPVWPRRMHTNSYLTPLTRCTHLGCSKAANSRRATSWALLFLVVVYRWCCLNVKILSVEKHSSLPTLIIAKLCNDSEFALTNYSPHWKNTTTARTWNPSSLSWKNCVYIWLPWHHEAWAI